MSATRCLLYKPWCDCVVCTRYRHVSPGGPTAKSWSPGFHVSQLDTLGHVQRLLLALHQGELERGRI